MFLSILCRVLLLMFVTVALLAPAASAAQSSPLRDLTFVVDPGHGGNDWGVDPAGSGLREKDVNPVMAAALVKRLAEAGATVAVTREGDRYVSLAARVRFGNALLFRPDNDPWRGRFLSLHLNSNPGAPNLRRVEVLVDPQAAGPFDFAEDMAARLRAATGGSVGYLDDGYPPGVHPADVAPVRWTYPRGHNVLTEPAYISNVNQAQLLRSQSFIDGIAEAHVEALRAEFKR